MKTYICDSCKTVIDNPYEQRMREFYVGCQFEVFGAIPVNGKRSRKVHLCDECFHALRQISKESTKIKTNIKIDGRTPDEIKCGLECCSKECACIDCTYRGNYEKLDNGCLEYMCGDALEYIHQLENNIIELAEKVAQAEAAQTNSMEAQK